MPRLRATLLIAFSLAGCGVREHKGTVFVEPSKATSSPVVRNPTIPAEVSYPIIEDKEEYSPSNKKRMIKVRLNMKVPEDVLREIALEVKATEKRQYERTFIFYYLPEQVYGVKASPWEPKQAG